MESQNPAISSSSVIASFMRANPPTIGHKKVIDKMFELAIQYRCDSILFLSGTHDREKNPIPFRTKRDIISKVVPGRIELHHSPVKDMYMMLDILSLRGYKTVYIVAGEDRVKEYEKFKKYTPILHFDDIIPVCAGERNEHSLDKSKYVSASYLRQLVKDDNIEEFKKLCILDEYPVGSIKLYAITALYLN